MKFDDAMKLAKKGERVRCDDYMSPGWAVAWVPKAKGFFNVNPHTGSTYQFQPEERDLTGEWNTQPRKQWMVMT
jgi:hypothetical protein